MSGNDNICIICFEPFVNPKQLTVCGHIFCTGCIKRYVARGSQGPNSGSTVVCPCCSKESPVTFEEAGPPPKPEMDNTVVKPKKVQPLLKKMPVEHLGVCTFHHNSELKYFCKNCKVPLCSKGCTDHTAERGHNVGSIEVCLERLKTDLKSDLDRICSLDEKAKSLEADDGLKKLVQEIEDQASAVIAKVLEQKVTMIQKVQEMLDNVSDEKLAKIARIRTDLSNTAAVGRAVENLPVSSVSGLKTLTSTRQVVAEMIDTVSDGLEASAGLPNFTPAAANENYIGSLEQVTDHLLGAADEDLPQTSDDLALGACAAPHQVEAPCNQDTFLEVSPKVTYFYDREFLVSLRDTPAAKIQPVYSIPKEVVKQCTADAARPIVVDVTTVPHYIRPGGKTTCSLVINNISDYNGRHPSQKCFIGNKVKYRKYGWAVGAEIMWDDGEKCLDVFLRCYSEYYVGVHDVQVEVIFTLVNVNPDCTPYVEEHTLTQVLKDNTEDLKTDDPYFIEWANLMLPKNGYRQVESNFIRIEATIKSLTQL